MKRSIAAMAALLLLVSCSSGDLAGQGDRSRAGKGKNAAGKGDGKKGKPAGGSAAEAKEEAEEIADEIDSAAGGGDTTEDAPQDFGGGDAPDSGIDPSLARAGASTQDSSTDARTQGLTPAYTEATGASIQGLGKNVRFVMTFNGAVPDRVEKDQYMVFAFGITGREENEGFALGATCDDKGWKPYAGSKGQNEKFPGSFEIDGNEIVMVLPWSYVQGPRAFEWYGSAGWYGKVANQTHWSFDAVPNQKAGNFPG